MDSSFSMDKARIHYQTREMEDLRKGIVDEKLAPELTPKQEKELTGKAV